MLGNQKQMELLCSSALRTLVWSRSSPLLPAFRAPQDPGSVGDAGGFRRDKQWGAVSRGCSGQPAASWQQSPRFGQRWPAPTSKAWRKPPTPFQLFLISSRVKIKIKGLSNLIPGQHLIGTCSSPSWQSERQLPPLPSESYAAAPPFQADGEQIPGLRWTWDPRARPSHSSPFICLLHSLLRLIANCTAQQGCSRFTRALGLAGRRRGLAACISVPTGGLCSMSGMGGKWSPNPR